jgi:hypothetical protein
LLYVHVDRRISNRREQFEISYLESVALGALNSDFGWIKPTVKNWPVLVVFNINLVSDTADTLNRLIQQHEGGEALAEVCQIAFGLRETGPQLTKRLVRAAGEETSDGRQLRR